MRRRPVLTASGLLAVGALIAATAPADAAPVRTSAAAAERGGFPGAAPLGDLDGRGPVLAPLEAAKAAVASLGASAQYNRWGTVSSMTRREGVLGTGTGSPEQVARQFLAAHSGLVGLSPSEVAALTLADDEPLASSTAHAVAFQQSVSGVPLADAGRVVLAVRDGAVYSLSSSTVPASVLGTLSVPATPAVSAAAAVVVAAKDAGITGITTSALQQLAVDPAWTVFRVSGKKQQQVARRAALPTSDRGVRLVWEVAVQDVQGTVAKAAQSYVDATSGRVLLRHDAVDTAVDGTRSPSTSVLPATYATQTAPGGGVITGSTDPANGPCSDKLPLDNVPAGTQTIVVFASEAPPTNDITISIFRNGAKIGYGDTGTTPEVATATIVEGSADGDVFEAQVCLLADSISPTSVPPYDFAGGYATSDSTTTLPSLPFDIVGQQDLQGPAVLKAFQNTPKIPPALAPDDRSNICVSPFGTTKDGVTCDVFTYLDASPDGYDVQPTLGVPTFATTGNNAFTANTQLSTSLTPGPPETPYVDTSGTRTYAPAFTDAWHTSQCDPTQTVLGADIDAAIVNLFTGHNRIHDFAYRLGLTEGRGALQISNFGKAEGTPGVMEGDPELGDAQNAAATHPAVDQSGVATGRDNANQITEMDGVPGITNQYLFEPVLGFYAPCTDGDLDATVFLHEYTHAISNRLVGGPAQTLSGEQGGSMGESWSDLVATEYLQSQGLAGLHGEDPYALGAYATGNRFKGIRDYNLRPTENPLNYGDFGFDSTGPEVHADGEIWNGIQMAVRQALIDHWNAQGLQFTNTALTTACALGHDAAGNAHSTYQGCPGNRRWVNYLFDGMILQAESDPTFIDIANNMLAGATARGSAEDRAVMADAFAQRGLGDNAASPETPDLAAADNTDPIPGFESETGHNASVTFDLVDAATGAKVPGQVFIGHYQARSTPVASTLGGANPPATVPVTAGTYELLVRADGYGLQRFTAAFTSGSTVTKTLPLERNVASKSSGAKVSGDGGVALDSIVDDDEATDGGFDGTADSKPIAGRTVTVDLGGYKKIDKVAVSALHHPAPASSSPVPIGVAGADDPSFQGRLNGVRAFDLQASTDGGQTYTTVYSSPDDFFPAAQPRPTAPDIALRTVDLPASVTADHLRMVIRTNQCTGGPGFNGKQKSDAAIALNGDSACAYAAGVPASNAGAAALAKGAAAPDTGNAQAAQVTVTELEAFGVPTTAPVKQGTTGTTGTTGATGTTGSTGTGSGTRTVANGRTLARTGSSVALGAVALLLMAGAGLGLRTLRRRSA